MTNESVERDKVTFEIKKWKESLAIEKEKLRLEKKNMWFTTGSIVIPLLVVAVLKQRVRVPRRSQAKKISLF